MRTIEETRLANFTRLRDELGTPNDQQVADAFGISKVYAWQLRNGKRSSIDSAAARKIERAANKPRGWLDTDFELWPFPGIDASRFQALTHDQRIEIQGLVRIRLEGFEQDATLAKQQRKTA